MKEKTASHGGLWTVVVLSLFLTALVGSTVLLGMHQSAQRSAQGEEPAASPNPTAFPGVMINGTNMVGDRYFPLIFDLPKMLKSFARVLYRI